MRFARVPAELPTFLVTAGLLFTLWLLFVPVWETNDDVAMAMIAHGYGLVTDGSPNLLFSNVAWGHFVRLLPDVMGTGGYSLATALGIFCAGWGISLFLVRVGTGYLVAFSAVLLLFLRPALVPQFTLNAGLLTVAGVVGWHCYVRIGYFAALIAAAVICFAGFLVRPIEFVLVAGIALPLLPWTVILNDRRAKTVGAGLIAAIGLCIAMDALAYRGSEWEIYNRFNAARAPLTDYGAEARLLERPDILLQHGYSPNDVSLVARFFFADPNLNDAAALRSIVEDLGPLSPSRQITGQLRISVNVLVAAASLPLAAAGLLLALSFWSWRVLMAAILFIAALVGMSILGRPGIVRVILPVLSLFCVAPIMLAAPLSRNRRIMAAGILLAAGVWNTFQLVTPVQNNAHGVADLRNVEESLPAEPFVVWGGGFPFQQAYPVFERGPRHLTILGLGAMTLAPFSAAAAEVRSGRLVERLTSPEGLPLLASDRDMALLALYCQEHHRARLNETKDRTIANQVVRRVSCIPSSPGAGIDRPVTED